VANQSGVPSPEPNSVLRPNEPASGGGSDTASDKKKGPLQKIFGNIFGNKKKKEPENPPRDKGDSP